MTDLDEFAKSAMPILYKEICGSNPSEVIIAILKETAEKAGEGVGFNEGIAIATYDIAEAMVKEGKKRNNTKQ